MGGRLNTYLFREYFILGNFLRLLVFGTVAVALVCSRRSGCRAQGVG
jgi:hypothetical protein